MVLRILPMLIVRTFLQIRALQKTWQQKGLSVGFVPTMGCLHEGHLSIIRQSRAETDITVCSIFVNPKQFNDPEDFKKYPRTTSQDIVLLSGEGCQVLYLPEVDDVYPPHLNTTLAYTPGVLAETLEGRFRPGHFQGMAEVVKRLLDIVQPHRLFMGQKDFQQFLIVKDMIAWYKLPVQIIQSPTVREESGLAMSSRNVRLTPEWKHNAPAIYAALTQGKDRLLQGVHPREVEETVIGQLTDAGFRVEYATVVSPDTLQPLDRITASSSALFCVAAWAGNIRLIDNIVW